MITEYLIALGLIVGVLLALPFVIALVTRIMGWAFIKYETYLDWAISVVGLEPP